MELTQRQPLNDTKIISGVDATVFAIYDSYFRNIGNISTFSYSIHREKVPVRRLGRSYPSGYTRGTRTIAGTMVFVNFDRTALFDLLDLFEYDSVETANPAYSILLDQLPPFDLLIVYQNEFGSLSYMRLLGVEITDEGSVSGVSESYIETTVQYLARDMSPLAPIGTLSEQEKAMFLADESLRRKFENHFREAGNIITSELQVQNIERTYPYHDDASDKLKVK